VVEARSKPSPKVDRAVARIGNPQSEDRLRKCRTTDARFRSDVQTRPVRRSLARPRQARDDYARIDRRGAGVAGKPGSKSGPAMTKSGPGSANQSGSNPDQSNVKGMSGNKSGPAVKPPSKKGLTNCGGGTSLFKETDRL
jgi:hypothetical protein